MVLSNGDVAESPVFYTLALVAFCVAVTVDVGNFKFDIAVTDHNRSWRMD